MINSKKWIMTGIMICLINACGGSSKSGEKLDTNAPVFISNAIVNVVENQIRAIKLIAIDENRVTYSIIEGDSTSFTLNAMTGVVNFIVAPNSNIQDIYNFTAIATDVAGNSVNQDIIINIIDVNSIVAKHPKKTGQTNSYNENGNIDNSIFDDGHYQTGTSSYYSRDDSTEIVTDHITELMWADDANVASITKQWLTDDNYAICDVNYSSPACFDTSSNSADSKDDTAVEYCKSLTLGGFKDWRLPTVNELLYIVDRSQFNPAMDTDFQHIAKKYYLSSTTIISHENYIWGVKFSDGSNTFMKKNSNYSVRCVRNEK